MNLLTKLLGRGRAENSANLAAEIEARKIALSEAQARVAAAASARAAALAELDGDGMARAEAEAADAARAVELGTKALDILTAAHARALEAEQAEAKAAALAVLVERRRLIGRRLETEYRAAAATIASVLSALAELQRDVAESGFEREVERSPEVSRGLKLQTEAVANVSSFLGDALDAPPTVPESPKEAAYREHQARRERERAERKAASDREYQEGRERLRASREAERQAEVARARDPFYPTLDDSAR